MLFNSLTYVLFLAFIFAIYWMLNHRRQNVFLLAASYVFYGAWDWRFLSLILISTLSTYYLSHLIAGTQDQRARKRWLILGSVLNLGILGAFKYFGFFHESLLNLLAMGGVTDLGPVIRFILPVGISFYTFQAISYLVDVYRKDFPPSRNLVDYSLYVCFFPQLVAGPIERPSNLLTQISRPRKLTQQMGEEAVFLLLWGFFKKVVVADVLGLRVDALMENPNPTAGIVFLIAFQFAFQIYADFSAYTDIARGSARLLGINLSRNFLQPYFSRNPQEFWGRWHITLSTWLRDYLYIPLGGNRKGTSRTYLNLMVTMVLGGLWHGAAWNFVIWGFYQGALLVAYRAIGTSMKLTERKQNFDPIRDSLKMLVMFGFALYGWLIFRASSMEQLVDMSLGLFKPEPLIPFLIAFAKGAIYCLPVIFIDVVAFWKNDELAPVKWPVPVLILFYLVLCYAIMILGVANVQQFIYFAF